MIFCRGCKAARTWSRSQGVGWWRWPFARCWRCVMARAALLHLAGRAALLLLAAALLFGPLIALTWRRWLGQP